MPVAFLIIKGDSVRLLPVGTPPGGPLDKALDLLPELINKVTAMIDQKKAEKKEAKSNQENPSKEK